MMHYVFLYEGPQWKQKAMAAAVVVGIFAVVLFPLWPIMLRQGVWYLSVGMMGLLGLFFAMAIFRLILFCITVFAVPPGLWLFPNLFEDVGFFDSFKPVWGWQEVCLLFVNELIHLLTLYIYVRKSRRRVRKRRKSRNLLLPKARPRLPNQRPFLRLLLRLLLHPMLPRQMPPRSVFSPPVLRMLRRNRIIEMML